MLEILEEAYRYKRIKGGRPSILNVLDKLVIMLQYYREYRTMDNIAFDYQTNKSIVYYAIKWTEETLIKNEAFHMPSGKKLIEDKSIEIVVVDATEVEIGTPSKKQKKYCSRKKKDILKTTVSGVNKHDFRLFKESRLIIPEDIFIIADSGYQGISHMHFSSLTPVKATKNHRLNDAKKAFNADLSGRKIFIEHINILSSHYRNKHRRFSLRISLICAIYNLKHFTN